MKDHCPLAVIRSCLSFEQLTVADSWCRLYLKRARLSRKSAVGWAIALTFNRRVIELIGVLLLFVGCGSPEDDRRYRERIGRAEFFCGKEWTAKDLPGQVNQPWYDGCVTGYMHHCTPTVCPEE